MTTILIAFIPLLSLLIVHLMIIIRIIMHKLLLHPHVFIYPLLINLIPEFLVHREMLHPCGLIDQVDVRLLLLLRVVVHIRLSL